MDNHSLMVFTGSANPNLAKKVTDHLNIKLGKANVGTFSDGETMVELLENVRGKDVFILQSTSMPTNDHLMEIMVMVDALKRSSAARITAAIPYLGYSRQDRRPRSARVAITAKVVANMLSSAGVDRLLTMDLHSDQIQGFFDIPVDNIYATPVLLDDLATKKPENLVIVSPDVGGVVRARAWSKILGSDLAIIDKKRPAPGKSEVMNILGDVKNKTCIIVDDIIDSGGTIVNAVDALKKSGANEVYVFISHGVLSGDAAKKIKNSKIKKLIVTDTIDNTKKIHNNNKIEVLSISSLMSEAIKRIANSNSVSDLFN